MKSKKITLLALVLALLMSLSLVFAACDRDEETPTPPPSQNEGDEGDGDGDGETEAPAEPITANVDYTVVHAPNLAIDGTNSGYADASIKQDIFQVSYPASETLTLYVEEPSVVEVTNGQTYTIGSVKTDTYTVTAKESGEYVFRLKKGSDLAAKLVYSVVEAYPEEPNLNPMAGYGTNGDLSIAYAHDPSVVEVDGVYYAFSTDNTGEYGYQVRKSNDMIRWEYVGAAIQGFGNGGDGVEANCKAGTSPLQEVYEIISRDHDWSWWGGGTSEGDNWTLWAPDVVEGADGKYWLYGCWTADFGSAHSIIFLCKADEVTGPYTFDTILHYSYDGGRPNPNAIDPQIYYVGNRMFMAYGSFGGGLWAIELDPATGRRLESDPYYGVDWSLWEQAGVEGEDNKDIFPDDHAARYGKQLVNSGTIEGPTVNYHEGVEVYEGGVADYTDAAVLRENRYYLMGTADSLSETYNMRSFVGTDDGDGNIAFGPGTLGNRVSGSFTWKLDENDKDVSFDFAYPGHNDMITTSTGRNLLAYHDRVNFTSGNANHYLLTSLYGYNSKGQLVMNPNRYAGEGERVVTAAEIANVSGGNYRFAYVTNNDYRNSYNMGYAMEGIRLTLDEGENASGGDIVFTAADGTTAVCGSWLLYGDNWVYMNITTQIKAENNTQILLGEFYGMAFPAYIEAEGRGGLALSLLSDDGANTLYLNMTF